MSHKAILPRRSLALRLLALSSTLALAAGLACSEAVLKEPGVLPDGGVTGEAGVGEDGGLLSDGGDEPVDAAAIPVTRDVSIIVQPSDKGQALIDSMRGAQKSLHVTMYLLTGSNFINAIKDAHAAGRDVKVVLNQNFPFGGNQNQSAYNNLKAAGVDVVWAPSAYTFTHSKTVIVDGTQAWIMTMNMTFSSPTDNREFLALDTDPADVADLEALFAADHKNAAVQVKGKLLVAPAAATPLDARQRLRQFIDSAATSVLLEGETFSDDIITAALVATKKRGVDVKVVLDGANTPTPAQSDAIKALKAGGIPVVGATSPDIHSKAIVVDGKRAYVGSINFTPTSMLQNREVGLIFEKDSEVKKVEQAIVSDLAKGTPL